MSRVLAISLLIAATAAAPARAQLAVIDPANLSQAVLIAERTWSHYDELRRQFDTIRRMAQGLGEMESFRLPSLPIMVHDPTRWEYGRTWLEALNNGDPEGSAYGAVTLPLEPPNEGLDRLSPAARRAFERQYSTVEITDSIARMGGHQVALIRNYYDRIQRAVEALEVDVLNGRPEFHEMTAVLDEIASGELLARRQDAATNQLLTHAVEQLLARSKRLRDTEAATINMLLTTRRDAHEVNKAFVKGTSDALRSWRQP
jgi:conjugal transfer/entry exclusion protein